ncbi:MAG: DUF1446 domain-containing protein [Gemmatimonadetes bacterium]|nr:DUF1446 domain-containing protein [Gemmatimonadota bacterium]
MERVHRLRGHAVRLHRPAGARQPDQLRACAPAVRGPGGDGGAAAGARAVPGLRPAGNGPRLAGDGPGAVSARGADGGRPAKRTERGLRRPDDGAALGRDDTRAAGGVLPVVRGRGAARLRPGRSAAGERDGPVSRPIRIAAGQGFWGDWLEAPHRQVTGGPIDYLMMDYLAEVTMSIMQKQKSRDPSLGYAKDFVPLMERILPVLAERRIKVTANAGGVNPRACAQAIAESARRLGLAGKLTIGVVTGDDLLPRLDDLLVRGHELRNLDTGRPLRDVRDRVQAANAYLGAAPVVEALRRGADIVITGRVTDTGLTLGPMIHAFGWPADAWDLLAAGTVAGHIIECGAQCSGGNCLVGWQRVPDLANVGYPIVEAHGDGSFDIVKHPRTGGRISVAGVTEQLVYEMGNPAEYITPDCVADFTTIQLRPAGKDRVRVSGVRGRPAPDNLKISLAYSYGYKAVGTLVYAWPEALKKARAADRILRQRLADLGLQFEAILTEFVGVNATHGPLARSVDEANIPEVQLRIGVRARDRAPVERFTREIAPLILNGPPSVTGFAGGRPKPEEIVAYWPALIDKREVEPCVERVDV